MSRRPVLTVAVDALPLAGPPTGVGVCCDQLLRALDAREDVEVTAYAVTRRPRPVRDRLPAGMAFRSLGLPSRVAHGLWRRTGIPSIESISGAVAVVHGTNFVVPPARRAASVVTVNDATPWKYPQLCAPASLDYPALVRRAVRRGAFVHTASHHVAAELSELVGVRAERLRVIPYGLAPAVAVPPTAPSVPLARADGTPFVDGPYVLAISTIEPRKDYPSLVRAFAKLTAAHPGLHLVIAGAEGRGSPAVDEAVAASRLEDRVLRLGYVADSVRAQLLSRARVLAYPSLYEGFGFPPLEAMAAGVPVVATAGGAVPEIVGDAALVVPVGDSSALADALERALADEELRAGLVARGRAQAAKYSWGATAEAMVALYGDAVIARG